MAKIADDGRNDRGLADVEPVAELGAIDRARKVLAPPVLQPDQRNAPRQQAHRGKRRGKTERHAELGALPLAVAHHVAALELVHVERRCVVALRLEDRPEQKWTPAHRDVRGLRQRADAHCRDIRIGRGEVVKEVECCHAAP
jgi:hypothetical protein